MYSVAANPASPQPHDGDASFIVNILKMRPLVNAGHLGKRHGYFDGLRANSKFKNLAKLGTLNLQLQACLFEPYLNLVLLAADNSPLQAW